MASDWLKWIKGLSRKREVRAVARKLGIDRRIVACACMEMWEWADDETCDGHIQGATTDDIDDQVSIPGFADALADSEVGWLRVTTSGISIPNFDRHNGQSAKRRALDSSRKSAAKVPHQKRKQSGTEKRREEKKESPKGDSPPVVPPSDPPWLVELWADWCAYKRERGETYKPKGAAAARKKLVELGEAKARAAITRSMECNYAGFFEQFGSAVGGHRSEAGLDAAAQRRQERTARECQPAHGTSVKVRRPGQPVERVTIGGESQERPDGSGDARA